MNMISGRVFWKCYACQKNISAVFPKIETRILFFVSLNTFTFWVPIMDIWGPILWFSYSFWQLGVGGPEKWTRNDQKSRTRKVKETWKYTNFRLVYQLNFMVATWFDFLSGILFTYIIHMYFFLIGLHTGCIYYLHTQVFTSQHQNHWDYMVFKHGFLTHVLMNDVQVTFSSDLVSSSSSSQWRNLGFTTLMAFLDMWKKVYVQNVKNKTAILYLKFNRKKQN